MSRFTNIESAEDHLMQAGLSPSDIEDLLNAAQHALGFQRKIALDADVPVGSSKLAGAPDLAPTTPWPTRPAFAQAPQMIAQAAVTYGPDGYVPNADLLAFFAAHWSRPAPLSFLAQIDLEAMAQAGPFDIGLPHKGRLLIFCDVASSSSGASANDDGWIVAIHDATPTADLVRRPLPDALVEIQTTNVRLQRYETGALDITQSEILVPFPIVTLPLETLRQPTPVFQALSELDLNDAPDLFGSTPEGLNFFGDQLGGHPKAIQNDVAYDLYESASPVLHPVTAAEHAGNWDPYRWTHLLSIAGESYTPAFPSSWGDGDLYIGHRSDPARADELGQIWAISQST